ncbi:DUF397 domain-containing protein [Streptomyces thermoalcalitolerans]|uniref:DUF397 domain-containing protein n=1 Tax=Streptomyces thermoalcalitolerans TaxID=65605 RepID=A0ABN1NP26_9ACTN
MSLKPSAGNGTELTWIKSSHSTPDGAACVEVASAPASVRVRDSKQPEGPQLAFGAQEWAAFVSYAADH